MRGRRGRARARGGGTRRRGAGTLNFHRGTGPGAGRDWDSPPERVPTGPWCHPRWAPPRRPRGGPDGPAPPRRGHTISLVSLHERAAAMAAPERQGAPPCPGGPKHVIVLRDPPRVPLAGPAPSVRISQWCLRRLLVHSKCFLLSLGTCTNSQPSLRSRRPGRDPSGTRLGRAPCPRGAAPRRLRGPACKQACVAL
jgi:hypothetical protein